MSRVTLLLITLLLGACAARGPVAPEGVRQAERYMGLGVQAFSNDDYAGASAMFAKAQAVYRSMDDLEGMVQSGINLAETAIAIGAWERAQRQSEALEPLARRSGRADYQRRVALLGAVALEGRRQRDSALARLQGLLPEFGADDAPRTALTPEALSAIVLRARMAFADKDADAAAQWARRLEQAVGKSGDTLVRARLLRFQGELARRAGDRVTARRRLDEALAMYRARASRGGTAGTLTELGALALEEQNAGEARDYLERALFIQMWILDRPGAAESLGRLAEVYAALGDEAKAAQARRWGASLASEGEPDWKQMRDQMAPAE